MPKPSSPHLKQETTMPKSIPSKILGLAVALVLAASPAIAKDKNHSHEGKHGGKMVDSGHHHLEIVAKDGILEVHVNDEDGKPEDIKDAKATAAILAEGKKEDIILVADPANFLKGAGAFKAAKGTTVVVTLTMPGHDPEQSRLKID
jgi:hypothetical protein